MTSDVVPILLNPAAGSAAELAAWRTAVAAADGFRLVECGKPGSLDTAARDAAAAGARTVVAAGGDGTLAAVLNAIGTGEEAPALGVLPFGTGNDFARGLGIPLESGEALRQLLSGELRETPLDAMRVTVAGESRLAMNAVNGGFGAVVGDRADPELKRLLGSVAYLFSGAREIRGLVEHRLRIRADDEELTASVWNFFAMNGRSVGGGVSIARDADPADGLLDLVLVPALDAPDLVARVSTALDPLTDDGFLPRRRVGRLRIEADPPMTLNRDGETCGETPVEVEVLPGAVRFLSPARPRS